MHTESAWELVASSTTARAPIATAYVLIHFIVISIKELINDDELDNLVSVDVTFTAAYNIIAVRDSILLILY